MEYPGDIFEEIRTAYSDAGRQRTNPDYIHEDRCLSFLASNWLTPGDAKSAVRFIGGYNAFDPENVVDALDEIADADPEATVAVGREGSPALYVETADPDAVVGVFDAMPGRPDELGVTDEVGKPRSPLYGDDGMDTHLLCRHDGPPVDDENIAPVRDDRQYVRAWWD